MKGKAKDKLYLLNKIPNFEIIIEATSSSNIDGTIYNGSVFLSYDEFTFVVSKKKLLYKIPWSHVNSVTSQKGILSNKTIIIYDQNSRKLTLQFTSSEFVVLEALYKTHSHFNEKIKKIENENEILKTDRKALNDEKSNIMRKLNEEQNRKAEVVENVVIKEIESKDLKSKYKLLKEELLNKDKYIEQIQNETARLLEEKQQLKNNYYSTVFSNINSVEENVNTTRVVPELDLSYTKVRKIPSTFVVLDFETTGLKYDEHEIIQYGVVEFKNNMIINEFTRYFKPNKPVGKTVMRKTGITNEFLVDKPKISKYYLEELLMLLGEKTIIAHNAPFDMKFLLKNLHDFNVKHEKFRVFDTLTASRRLIDETPNHKLETLKNYFDLDNGDSHEALNDARATGNLALLLHERSI